jgi:hypothetical protein
VVTNAHYLSCNSNSSDLLAASLDLFSRVNVSCLLEIRTTEKGRSLISGFNQRLQPPAVLYCVGASSLVG